MKDSIRILVVDDEASIRKRCVRLLARQGYSVAGVGDSHAALELIQGKNSPFDVLLVDIRMPGMDGLELLDRVKTIDSSVEVIVMTGYATVETAVKAMKSGAYDYLVKPFDVDELAHVVKNVAEKRCLQREVAMLRLQLQSGQDRPLLFGSSSSMNEVSRFIRKVAPVDCNILISSESGTGKELVARAIHANSPRRELPFVVADCAALSGGLLESELFGHLKGAFTGAHQTCKGYFETADQGTLFLDEISELPIGLQGKLLRAVQEQVICRVGSTQQLKVNVRIIAATNRNLEELVRQDAFREDLFYRLNVMTLTIPPLRDRKEDIPLLARHFLKRYTAQLSLPQVPRISDETMRKIMDYGWPGNVRELENAVQRAVVLAENGALSVENLLPAKIIRDAPLDNPPEDGRSFQKLRRQVVLDFTRTYLTRCLRSHEGNVSHSAKALGMRRTSLQKLLKESGLDARTFRK
jgi:DNA-binding NtrC family response regulator